ncbi:hypothetical protein [Nocardia cyriacigeorgica]|uniref:hypothetical protein n=1 Tax=Nocardia cyriacigeorgica TaxID=135487 RepID=UPI002456AF0D|nr:hypothetical protein [Nocardia cyriacigeorgica]
MFGSRGVASTAAMIAILSGIGGQTGSGPAAADYGGLLAIDDVGFLHAPDSTDDSAGHLAVTVTYSCADGEADTLHVYAYEGAQSPSRRPSSPPHGPGYAYDIICDTISRRKTVVIDASEYESGSGSGYFTNGAQGRVTAELRRGTTTTRHATGRFEWRDATAGY